MKTQPEEKLQAVILLEVEEGSTFEPLTLHTPRCLLPLGNTPLIEYTLEWLSIHSNVSDIYLVGFAFTIGKVKEYIEHKSFKWSKLIETSYILSNSTHPAALSSSASVASAFIPNIQYITLPSNAIEGLGDALRELDASSIIKGDFILIRSPGDLISNVNLGALWDAHRNRRAANKNAIMTSIYKKLSPGHRTRSRLAHPVLVLDGASSRLIGYEEIDPVEFWLRPSACAPNGSKKRTKTALSFPFNTELLDAHSHIDLRYDLVDTHVDLCSLEVLALFTENFDYQDLRQDFMKGILLSDILSYQFYVHILTDEYMACASTPFLYDAISRDLLERWIYPIVPEANLFDDPSGYALRHGLTYLSRTSVKLSR